MLRMLFMTQSHFQQLVPTFSGEVFLQEGNLCCRQVPFRNGHKSSLSQQLHNHTQFDSGLQKSNMMHPVWSFFTPQEPVSQYSICERLKKKFLKSIDSQLGKLQRLKCLTTAWCCLVFKVLSHRTFHSLVTTLLR